MSTLAALAGTVAERTLGGAATAVSALAGGTVGATYKVRLTSPTELCVVKLTPAIEEPDFADEPAEIRVYGARASNFGPAYFALSGADAPLPRFWHRGELEGWRYLVLEALDGVDLRDTLGQRDARDMEGLQAAAGDVLGRLHQVTRSHQGWIDAPPVGDGWRADFLSVFALHRARLREVAPPELADALDARAADWASLFRDPPAFVLSHTDGVQAMALHNGARWGITGLVDLEDYQFTDPRFALAGHELAAEFHGRRAPEAFWRAYQAHKEVDPSFRTLQPMFRAFYLTVWARVLRDHESARLRCLDLLARIVRAGQSRA